MIMMMMTSTVSAARYRPSTTMFLLAVYLVLSVVAGRSNTLQRISIRDQWLTDEYGRVRLFHGANSVQKSFPWYDAQALNETRLEYFKSWGFNVIRLGTMWTGVQPEIGTFNQTYINVLKSIVEKFADHGIYALLDVHQDGLSSSFGGYDGIPEWVFERLPKSKHAYPWPFKGNKTTDWWESYLTEACSFAFQKFYENKGGSLDYFMAFWQKIATVFKDSKSVIGYELLNEPWAGDVYADPLIILPGMAGKYNLKPMYDQLNTAIRRVDNNTLLFFEPTTIGVVFNGSVLGTGFDSPPGGDLFRNRSVLAWHYYCWFLGTAPIDPYTGWKRDACDEILGPKVFYSILEDSNHLKIPTFMTEFGLCVPDSSKTSKETLECNFVMKKADENFQSWTYWDSEFFDSRGNLNMGSVKAFARTYARAVAGTPTLMSYNVTSKEFLLEYVADTSITQPTEIFLPKLHYTNGFSVTVTPGLKWSWDDDCSCVLVTATSDHSTHLSASVNVLPKL